MKKMICIVCPNSCELKISVEGEQIAVSGNMCPKGIDFAVAELTNPMRTISSTVKTSFPGVPVLPVKVSGEIPKSRIFDVMAEINKTLVSSPIDKGEALIADVLGLGVDVIATSGILKQKY